MKIEKIYISAFGGLKDYSLDLTNGFQVVFGENENGKSTVMSFLKMMFYGNDRGGQQLSKNMRKKYQPWSGDAMGGRVFFFHNGIHYCLEREFKGSNSTDAVRLRNLDLGTSESAEAEIGKRFFGLGAAAFERSVFIGHPGVIAADGEANGELNARLSGLALTGTEDTSYRTVYDRLNSAEQALTTPRKVGLYDKGVQYRDELTSRLSRADEAAKERETRSAELKQIALEIKNVRTAREEQQNILKNEIAAHDSDAIRRYLETKEALDRAADALRMQSGAVADEQFCQKLGFGLSKYDAAHQRAVDKAKEIADSEEKITLAGQRNTVSPDQPKKLQKEIDLLRGQINDNADEAKQLSEKLNNAENELESALRKKKPIHPILFPIGLILLAAGIAVFLLHYSLPGAIVGGVGIILTVLGLILRPKDRTAVLSAEQSLTILREQAINLRAGQAELQEKINVKTEELNSVNAILNTDQAMLERMRSELAQQTEQLTSLQNTERQAADVVLRLFRDYAPAETVEEVKTAAEELNERAAQLKQLKLQLAALSKALGGMSYEQAEEKLGTLGDLKLTDADFDTAREKLQELTERENELSAALSAGDSELKAGARLSEDPQALRRELSHLEKALADQKEYCDALRIAKKVLEDSFAEVRRSYGSVLEQKTLSHFSGLTDGRYRAVAVSDAMELEAESTDIFGTRSIEYLSGGTADQAYLSLRLALSELISPDEPLPILLDDVLERYDDSRTARAIDGLKQLSGERQIVLFTCHRAVCDAARENSIPVIPFSQS